MTNKTASDSSPSSGSAAGSASTSNNMKNALSDAIKDPKDIHDTKIKDKNKESKGELKDPNEKFEGVGVVFKAKLIGLELVPEARGDKMCQNSIVKLKAIIKGTNTHKRRIIIKISFDGIKVYDEKTNEILHHHKVPEISYIAKDDQDSRTFGYVFGVPSKTHQFICFKTAGPAANIMSVIGELFACVLQRKQALQSQNQNQKSGTETASLTGASSVSASEKTKQKEISANNLSALLFDFPASSSNSSAPESSSTAPGPFWSSSATLSSSNAQQQQPAGNAKRVLDNVFENEDFDTFPVFLPSPSSEHKQMQPCSTNKAQTSVSGNSGSSYDTFDPFLTLTSGNASSGSHSTISTNAGVRQFDGVPLLPSPPSKHRQFSNQDPKLARGGLTAASSSSIASIDNHFSRGNSSAQFSPLDAFMSPSAPSTQQQSTTSSAMNILGSRDSERNKSSASILSLSSSPGLTMTMRPNPLQSASKSSLLASDTVSSSSGGATVGQPIPGATSTNQQQQFVSSSWMGTLNPGPTSSTIVQNQSGASGTGSNAFGLSGSSGTSGSGTMMKPTQNNLPRQQSWSGEFDRYAAFSEIDVMSSVFETALATSNNNNNNTNNNINSNSNKTNTWQMQPQTQSKIQQNSSNKFSAFGPGNNANKNRMDNNNLFDFSTEDVKRHHHHHGELTRSSSSGATSQSGSNIFSRKNPFADEFFS